MYEEKSQSQPHQKQSQCRSIAASQEGILLQLADGSIQACNAIAQQILGVTIEQMQGYTYLDYPWQTVYEDGSPFPSELHPPTIALRTSQPCANVVMGFYQPNGVLIWLSIGSQPLFRANETAPYAVLTTFIEITEQKQKCQESQAYHKNNLLASTDRQEVQNKTHKSQVILCVDDDDANRYVTCHLLQQAGFETWEATTGREALQLAAQQPDLIVLDVMLPDIDGIDVCQHLKTEPKTALIPILHLSAARTTTWDKVQGLDSGADSYLTQPVEPLELLANIRALLRMRDMQKALYRSEKIVRQQLTEIETIYATAPIGLCFVDTELRFVRINARLAEINGLPASEHIGRTLREVIPEMADQLEPLYRHVIESAEAILNLEVRGTNRAKPGLERDWLLSLHPLQGEDRRVLGVNVTVQEITEQQAALRDRRHAETALAHTNSILQAVFEGTDDVIFVKDVRGRYIIANQAAVNWLDITVEEILGKDDTDLFAPDIARHILQTDRQVISSGESISYEEEIPKQGIVRSLLTTKYPWRDSTGNILGVIGISRDISERKQTEAQLKANEERLKTFFEANVIGIIYGDIYGGILEANDEFLRIVGYTREDLNSGRLRWIDITPEEYLSLDEERIAEARARGACTPYEKEYIRPDGSRIPVLVGYGLVGETREESVAFILDLSDRVSAEDALRRSEERYRILTELSPQIVWQTTPDGYNTYCNQYWFDYTGLTREETVGEGWLSVIHPDDRDRVMNVWKQSLATDTDYEVEIRFLRAEDGEYRTHVARGLPVRSSTGEILKWVGIALDIHDRKQTEEELIRLNATLEQTTQSIAQRNQELDNFAYIVSHDLKAPLRAIANLSVWIEEDLQGQLPPENLHQIELLRSRVYRMESLINGLLQYSRVGRTEVATETVNVGELLLEIIDSLAPPVTFTIEVQPNMPTLLTKQLLLSQVFSNLISNAIKHHNSPNGRIVISAIERGDYYEFSVSDDGSGIALADRDRVFEIFKTLKSGDTNENTGLGLSIVKKIVETEGGEITLDSELGKGTTFRFTWLKQPKSSV
ncbi:MAG: PAS domain S-box protein [Hydrococcus sp. Prado102]|jgi:PAS domain S-box-containing protein|nr:PAS domain S-box protein [Hydrococcus sp. Prado102]